MNDHIRYGYQIDQCIIYHFPKVQLSSKEEPLAVGFKTYLVIMKIHAENGKIYLIT